MRIVAFGHKARQGKTWAANYLARILPGRTLVWGIGDSIKTVARVTEGMGLIKDPVLLQKVGLSYRDEDPNVWIRAWQGTIYDHSNLDWVLVPDLRFRNEARFLREEMGASLFKVVRHVPGSKDVYISGDRPPDHPSEIDLDHWDEWDAVIEAESTLGLASALIALEPHLVSAHRSLDLARMNAAIRASRPPASASPPPSDGS